MNPQIKDHFYDQFLKEPTKDNFRDFMKKSCGELNEMDFKETWIDKGPLAKIMLAMANNGGGIIIFGVKENEDNTFDVLGLDNLKDTADISNSISRLVSSSLDYEVYNFVFDSDVYGEFENKKFQIMVIHDTPERLPFVSLGQSEKIEKDVIYVRRGTKSEKATSEEINRIIERKNGYVFRPTSGAIKKTVFRIASKNTSVSSKRLSTKLCSSAKSIWRTYRGTVWNSR